MNQNPLKATMLQIAPSLHAACRELDLPWEKWRTLARGKVPYLPVTFARKLLQAGVSQQQVAEVADSYRKWQEQK